jgi:aspartate racemase
MGTDGDRLRDRIAGLTPEKRALLEKRLLERRGGSGQRTIPRRRSPGACPLSFAQQRLWFLAQLEPQSPFYNCPSVHRLTGPLNEGALRRALNAVVARHESLRTTFFSDAGTPKQRVAAQAALELPVVDLRREPAARRWETAWRLIEREAARPYDLSRDLMLRARLVRLEDEEDVLLTVTHHIATDGWSAQVFQRELSACYEAFSDGVEPALPELPVQYADFACWQREWLQGDVLEGQLSYWREQLREPLPVLELPADRRRPAVLTHSGARLQVALPGALLQSVQALSRREKATAFMCLLAAFNVLLHRLTGQDDIVVGSPIANRNHLELEGLIGFFANTLALRTDLSGDPTFLELLARVREVALAAYAHQDMPFERLVEELLPERDASRAPLVQAMFALQNRREAGLRLGGLEVRSMPIHTGTAKVDMILTLSDSPNGLLMSTEYSTDLFEEETIVRLGEHFGTLLEGIVADPDRRISRLPLMGEAERHGVVVGFNETQAPLPDGACIHGVFEEQARRRPEAVAATCGNDELTYGELDLRADRLAHRLRDCGVQRGVTVGLCMERSLEMLVGMVGILKAGGAYMPLDPEFPPERLSFMLADAQAPALVTAESLLGRLPSGGVRLICLDRHEPAAGASEPASSGSTPDDVCYVIYTSGSTGRPKGVAVPHRAVLRLVLNADYVELGPSDVVAQASTTTFDAATFEVWGPLLNGGRLVIADRDLLLSPRRFADLLRREGLTTLFLTTALFNQFALECPDAFSSLRALLFGGEAVDPLRVREVLRAGPPARLLHVYGPTETTTFASWHLVEAVPENARTVPIGRPIANTRIYLLDAGMQPVPVGFPGELYIAGAGVAAGYVNRPELTAERFLPDPFVQGAQERLYRTGDLGRWLPDGSIEFLGRLDDQVKIRGFRVEPGETEAVLSQHPAVRQAAVLARQDAPGEKRLVGYAVLRPGRHAAAEELLGFLRQKLPAYMVPSALEILDALPLNPHGKVDRAALPVPQARGREAAGEPVPPGDALEYGLRRTWQDVTGVWEIGVEDNFFRLGGHSLMAVRLLAEVEKRFGERLPLKVFFQRPTIRQMAETLRSKGWRGSSDWLVTLQAEGDRRPVFFVNTMNAWDLMDLAAALSSVRPSYGLHPLPCVKDGRFGLSMEELAARYVREVRGVQPEGPYLLVGLCMGGAVGFEMARQLRGQEQQVALLALLDAPPPGRALLPYGLRRLLRGPERFFADLMRYHVPELIRRNPLGQWRYVRQRLRNIARRRTEQAALSRRRRELPEPLRDYRAELEEANRRLLHDYRPRAAPVPIALFFPSGTGPRRRRQWQRQWERLTMCRAPASVCPGDHESMWREANAPSLGAELRALLEDAVGPEG